MVTNKSIYLGVFSSGYKKRNYLFVKKVLFILKILRLYIKKICRVYMLLKPSSLTERGPV